MKYIVTGKNINVTEALKERTIKKLSRIEKFFKPETEAHITFYVQKNRQVFEVTIKYLAKNVLRVRRLYIMKKKFFFFVTFILFLSVSCCTEQDTEKDEILAKINDYELTQKEFEDLLVSNIELEENFKLTKEAKKLFLDQLIQKELLIQEAKRLRLDTKQKFIRAIQLYWESTLIRDLMELKGKEFNQRTYVTQEEIEDRYKEMKNSPSKLPPFERIAKEISEKLKEKKKREKLREWVNSLRKTAKIEINEEQLLKD